MTATKLSSLKSQVANLTYVNGLLTKQIERLILNGDDLAEKLEDMYGNQNRVVTWKEEADRAAELLK